MSRNPERSEETAKEEQPAEHGEIVKNNRDNLIREIEKMRLSSKGRYGVRAMLDLAILETQTPVALKDISQREEISLPYLEQIFNKLRRAGLVKSKKGPGGGFLLAKSPREIKIMDIIKALKVPVLPVYCLDKGKEKSHCDRINSCVPRFLWKRLGERIKETLEETDLEDLLRKAKIAKQKT